jgi:hypothetical protein
MSAWAVKPLALPVVLEHPVIVGTTGMGVHGFAPLGRPVITWVRSWSLPASWWAETRTGRLHPYPPMAMRFGFAVSRLGSRNSRTPSL